MTKNRVEGQDHFLVHMQTGSEFVRLSIAIFSALFAIGCARQEENKNFSLSLESSASVAGNDPSSVGVRCDVATQLDCGRMNFVTGDGYEIDQEDSFASCAITPEGDLKVVVQATSDDQSTAKALFLVHRNTSPNGTARCEGIRPDPASATGFARSSCDVIIQFGSDIFAANPFDKCTATIESDGTIKGTLSCPILRSGKTKTLLVNAVGFYCVPTQQEVEAVQFVDPYERQRDDGDSEESP